IDWLIDIDPDPARLSAAHDRWWPEFLKRAGHVLPEPLEEIGERLREHLAPILRHLTRTSPRTLVHSDYKLENLIFGGPAGGVPFAVIDWQLMGRGRGVWDVAYFLAQSLHPEARRAVELDLLRTYHHDLVEGGVRGYTFEACLYDFRLSLLRRFGSLISTIAAMPFTEEQIRMHVDVLLPRTCAAILDHAAGELLS
ncbi:MAG: phosphotransferase, partial [Myxococcota bacterium]